ncbi:MAG: MarR family winged helix-turn-helix transcriptional regulator [Frankia sp.]
MAPAEPATAVTVLLTRLSRIVYRRSPHAVLGMELRDFSTLNQLREYGTVPQQTLGDLMCLEANYLVRILNDLESAGRVARRRDPTDRRRHLVEITPAGRAALTAAEEGMASLEDDVLGPLSPAERDMLRHLLTRALAGQPPH